jgi:hypothetical protein
MARQKILLIAPVSALPRRSFRGSLHYPQPDKVSEEYRCLYN